MKKRWKGLCALWMVLVLVIGAVPVTGAAEGMPEQAPVAIDGAVEDGGGQTPADSGAEGSPSEIRSETSSSETESTELEESESTERSEKTETSAESSAEDGNGEEPGQGRETEEPDNGTGSSEAIEGSAEGNGESTKESTEAAKGDGTAGESSEAVSEENESESGKPEEGGTAEEISSEESSVEEISSEESSLEEGSLEENIQKEILETTDPELLENAALLAKAVAREAVTSGDGWLYVGSDEVRADGFIGDGESIASHRKQVTVQFNKSFDSQDEIMNITIPQDKRLSGWRLWGFNNSGFVGKSPLGDLEITGQISAEDYQNFGIDGSALSLLIVPLWRDAKDILDGDSLEMNAGESCNLLAGTWRVDIKIDASTTTDTTVYTGGRTVYAAKSGTFTFHKTQ